MVGLNILVKLAIEQAQQSTHKHRIGCVIFRKKEVLSTGRNYGCRSSKHLHPRFTKWKGSLHAEAAAIISARCDLKGASILIIRLNRGGNLRLARPCKQCIAYLEFVKIKWYYYSTNEGTIVKEKIE